MNMGPPIVGAGCAAFASLGYLIIWAIAAGIVNAEVHFFILFFGFDLF